MWPLIVLGFGALIVNAFSEEDEKPKRIIIKRRTSSSGVTASFHSLLSAEGILHKA
jgi:hypothetical protein